jgi:hypothetical protein
MKRSMVQGRAALALFGALMISAPVASAQAPAQPAPRPHTAGMPDIDFPPNPPVAQITLAPGLNTVGDYRPFSVEPPPARIPAGFTSLFNGKDLTGWHISKTARHGANPNYFVMHGMILGTQRPLGSGGLLITDKKFKNYEFFMEVKPDWGNDSGVFLRTTENGAAYQVTLDYLPGGSMGRTIQEGGLIGVGRPVGQETPPPRPAGAAAAPAAPDPGMSAWKHNEWNTVRIRVEGASAPHVTVWINDKQVSDFTDQANRAAGGMVEGPIAIQIHGGNARWMPGGFWRWRNLAIKELP